ncbi:MAG TPA: type IV pilin protein [Burkholderiaceae bacterium]|nr:type IV pilin protein [Burkholderiaceae bacterium]
MTHTHTSSRRVSRGFTLIELMATVSIAGVLSSVALPSFERQLQKARRTDAVIAAVQVQAAQERYRSNAPSYAALSALGLAAKSTAGHYTLQVDAVSADGYELLAVATGAQARDAGCRYMKLASSGLNATYSSGPDATLANAPDANRRCWSL